jgi:hypothetical protein
MHENCLNPAMAPLMHEGDGKEGLFDRKAPRVRAGFVTLDLAAKGSGPFWS